MKLRLPRDEVNTIQDMQLKQLGPDFYNECDEQQIEPAFGADPFDILAHKQEQGELQ